jgi:hypothetical protein
MIAVTLILRVTDRLAYGDAGTGPGTSWTAAPYCTVPITALYPARAEGVLCSRD